MIIRAYVTVTPLSYSTTLSGGKLVGGSVNLDLSNSPTTSFGDDQVSTKFNHKKSEFGLQYAVRYRNPYHIWTEGVETFRFESGETMERTSEGSAKRNVRDRS